MATISSTLRLNDQISGSLRSIVSGLGNFQARLEDSQASTTSFSLSGVKQLNTFKEKITDLIKSVTAIGDQLILASTKMSLIGREGENVAQINDSIYASAIRSRLEYSDMVDTVSKLGMAAGDVFSNTDEVVGFTELMEKSFAVGGTGIQEQAAAMWELTNAMAAGKMSGDGLDSLLKNAPIIAESVGEYTGKSMDQLMEMAAAGELTAEVIKQAMFYMSEEINGKFGQLPVTWNEQMNKIKTVGLYIFGDLFQGISNTLVAVTNFLVENADVVLAILAGVAVFISAMIVPALVRMAIMGGIIAAEFMLVNLPITLIALGVIALIALFLKFPPVFGVIIGAVKAVGTFITNMFKAIGNTAIFIINMIIEGLNKIPGVEIKKVEYYEYRSVSGSYKEGYNSGIEGVNKVNNGIDNFKNVFKGTPGASSPTGTGAGTKGVAGLGVGTLSQFKSNKQQSNIPGANNQLSAGGSTQRSLSGIGSGIDGLNDKLSGKGSLKSGGKVEIKAENLKYLLDISKNKYQKEYQKAPVSIVMNTGDINSGTDENRLMKRFENIVVNAFSNNLEVSGV